MMNFKIGGLYRTKVESVRIYDDIYNPWRGNPRGYLATDEMFLVVKMLRRDREFHRDLGTTTLTILAGMKLGTIEFNTDDSYNYFEEVILEE